MAVTFPTADKDARAQAVVDAVNAGTTNAAGTLRLLDSGDNVLSSHVMSNPAFGAVSNGTATAAAIAQAIGLLDGAAVKFEVLDRDNNLVFSGTVGAVGSGEDLESTTSSTTVSSGDTVDINSLIYMEVS